MNKYKIIILGASGSGKTVYLASMYHRLSVQHENTGFFLTLPSNQRKILVKKYGQITKGNWPRPTQRHDVSKWVFTCKVQNEKLDSFDALTFQYLDYAGEKITEPSEEEGSYANLDEVAENADGILAILDGHKLLAELTNRIPPGGVTIFEDISHIIPMIQEKNRSTPVHFIVSKWDLLDGKFNLQHIRNTLMEYPPFRAFVNARVRGKAKVRLIPISSVGMNFATLTKDGIMQKNTGSVPNPYNVEMPLAFTLIDKLQALMEQAIEQENLLQEQRAPKIEQYTWWEAVKKSAAGIVRDIRGLIPKHYRYTDPVFYKLIDYLETDAKLKDEYNEELTQRFLRERDISLKNVRDEHSAFEHVIDQFIKLAKKLDKHHSESDLTKEMN